MAHEAGSILPALLVLAIAGAWDGKVNELPAVELILRDDGGKVSGSIGFYFQSRGDDGKWRLGEKTTLPLLSPKLEGKVLSFETIHHKKHGSPELGPNNKYRVTFAAANEARLWILREKTKEDGSGLKLTRR